jgi:hypothetical protein
VLWTGWTRQWPGCSIAIPRDFTLGQFKYKSTPVGQPPSDADLIRAVSDGLAASAMPSWKGVLSEVEIREVVTYVKGLSTVFTTGSPQPATIPPRVPPDASSIARRRQLFATCCMNAHVAADQQQGAG